MLSARAVYLVYCYRDHISHAQVRYQSPCPPVFQLLRLRLFGQMARAPSSCDRARALWTIAHGLQKDSKRPREKSRSTWLCTVESDLQPAASNSVLLGDVHSMDTTCEDSYAAPGTCSRWWWWWWWWATVSVFLFHFPTENIAFASPCWRQARLTWNIDSVQNGLEYFLVIWPNVKNAALQNYAKTLQRCSLHTLKSSCCWL